MKALMSALAVLIATAAISSCASSSDPSISLGPSADGPAFTGPTPTLTTDQGNYVATPDPGYDIRFHFTVVATLHNDSDQTIYLGTCGSPAPEYGVRGDPVPSAYSPNYACSGGQIGLAVLAHSVRIDTLRIAGPNLISEATHTGYGATNGTISIGYTMATCPDVERCHAGQVAVLTKPLLVETRP